MPDGVIDIAKPATIITQPPSFEIRKRRRFIFKTATILMPVNLRYALKTAMVAALLVGLLTSGTAAWAQTVDGLTYAGDGVEVTGVEADIEFGEVVISIVSTEGGTLTITLDPTVLGMVEGDFTTVVDGNIVEFTLTSTDSMVEIMMDIPAGGSTVVLSGLEDAIVVASSPDTTEQVEETEPDMAEEVMVEETIVEETVMEEVMVEETVSGMVADFMEPGVDISVYVDRYLHDEGFSSWYDEWYPTMAFHDALGITQAEYQEIVDSLTGVVECPAGTELMGGQCVEQPTCGPGTTLEDGVCVADSRTAAVSASDADGFRAQGEGLQLGVAAAAGFGGAVGVVLLLWLPSRIRKRWIK